MNLSSPNPDAYELTAHTLRFQPTDIIEQHYDYGYLPTQFGQALVVLGSKGICFFGFPTPADTITAIQREYFPTSTLVLNQVKISRLYDTRTLHTESTLVLTPKGSDFQRRVWQALLEIPSGETCSYLAVAKVIGQATAVRAVASAIARNPVSYYIPCHRVVRTNGGIGQYRWQSTIKTILLTYEKASSNNFSW